MSDEAAVTMDALAEKLDQLMDGQKVNAAKLANIDTALRGDVTGETAGVLVRLDRLEQDKNKDTTARKTALGALATAAGAILTALMKGG